MSFVQKETPEDVSLAFSEDVWKELQGRVGWDAEKAEGENTKEYLHAALDITRVLISLRNDAEGEKGEERRVTGLLTSVCEAASVCVVLSPVCDSIEMRSGIVCVNDDTAEGPFAQVLRTLTHGKGEEEGGEGEKGKGREEKEDATSFYVKVNSHNGEVSKFSLSFSVLCLSCISYPTSFSLLPSYSFYLQQQGGKRKIQVEGALYPSKVVVSLQFVEKVQRFFSTHQGLEESIDWQQCNHILSHTHTHSYLHSFSRKFLFLSY